MKYSHRLCVAPMMDWTDRHCRYFHRLLDGEALLYTEMIHARAVISGDREYLLSFSEQEHPVAVQLGGNDPEQMATAAQICQQFGYDEININVGCPSDRVQSGAFGACLMSNPELVAACVTAMKAMVDIPVTVKCRIGIDDLDSYEFLDQFVQAQIGVGVDALIVHARIALLSGLSPKQNRTIPPLNYKRVERLKVAHPQLRVVLNGGIASVEHVLSALAIFDGVMLGRAAYQDPWIIAQCGQALGTSPAALTRADVAQRYMQYMKGQREQGVPLQAMSRHVLGLYSGQPGARVWRRYLSQHCHLKGATESVIAEAIELVDQQQLITYK